MKGSKFKIELSKNLYLCEKWTGNAHPVKGAENGTLFSHDEAKYFMAQQEVISMAKNPHIVRAKRGHIIRMSKEVYTGSGDGSALWSDCVEDAQVFDSKCSAGMVMRDVVKRTSREGADSYFDCLDNISKEKVYR